MKQILVIILFVINFISAIEVVLAKHDTRRLFNDIQILEKEGDNLNEEWGRLQLEQSTWATDAKIESTAIQELNMKMPDINTSVLIK